jgi:hypothetical protein
MAVDGLIQSALLNFNAVTGTTHIVKGDQPLPMQGLNKYVFTDAAAYRLGMVGGDKFDFQFNPKEGNDLKVINPGGLRSLSRTDNIRIGTQRIILMYQDMAFVDAEIEKNEGLTSLAEAGRWDLFYDRLSSVKKNKEAERAVTLANKLEKMTSAVPNFTTMEDRNQSKPTQVTSLMALVNEWFNACFGITTATGLTAGSAGTDYNTAGIVNGRWTTKFGLTVNDTGLVAPNGRNVLVPRQVSYSTIDNTGTGFFNAMLRALRETSFQVPTSIPNTMLSGFEYKGNTADSVWYASGKLLDLIQAVVNTQHIWVAPDRRDPNVTNPIVGGVPVEWWPEMDTYAGYAGATNTTLVTEGQGDAKGPRAILHRRDSLFPVAHKLNWFRERKITPAWNTPDVYGSYLDVEWNWTATDLRRQAIVFPSTTPSGISAY